jgi:hypothetical protein
MSVPNPNDYARGTANWQAVADAKGVDAANAQWQAAIDAYRSQTPLDTSTWHIFGNQLATDPLAAPLESANKIASNSFLALLKSPAVLLVLGIAAFFFLGGADLIRRKMKGA